MSVTDLRDRLVDARSSRYASSQLRARGSQIRYISGLDGIRGIAVLAVLLFHGGVLWLPGGFLGVDVFFVLSGFLITSILLKERETTGTIRFGRFYLGRARRLLPALLLVLATTALIALVFARDAAAQVKTDILASLGYVSNWWYVFHDLSYFQAIGRPPLLQHLWSLALEEQFYLLWPALLLIAFRWRGRPGVRRFALVGAAGSTILMATMAVALDMPIANDPSRLYFGTDTHAMSVLLGAALATLWRPERLPQRLKTPAPFALSLIGTAALAALVWSFHVLTQDSTFLYVGGFLIVAAVSAILVAVASHPASQFGRLLGMQPMRYLGTRSYGLYLWHWPVFMIIRPGIDIGLTGLPALALRLAVTVLVAEASFRFVEMPVRRGALAIIWRRWRIQGRSYTAKRLAMTVLPAAIAISIIALALAAVAPPGAADYLGGRTSEGAGQLETKATLSAPTANPSPPGVESRADTGPTPLGNGVLTKAPSEALIRPGSFATTPITAIGDSVLLGASSTMKTQLKKLTVDADISRQTSVVLDRIRQRKAAGQLDDTVIVHTGTNGPPTTGQLSAILKLLSDRQRVVLVNTRMPDRFMNQANTAIASVAPKFPNVRLADWASASNGHREYFVVDGTHTTPTGAAAFLATVEQALEAP